MASEETFVVVIERYVQDEEPLLLRLNKAEVGIPVFDEAGEAEEFLRAFWEVLGPGYETKEISARELGELLMERCADQAGCAIISPPPTLEGGWRVMDLRRFAQVLSEG